MSAECGARASVSRCLVHGLIGWGILACVAGAILVSRTHTAQAARAPLPPMAASLSAAERQQWASFPDYHTVVPVLVYQGVGGHRNYLTVSREVFAEQMRALMVAGFHTLTIQQYASFVRHGGRGLPSRPILLTFDGAHLDAYRAVNGILRRYGFHATELVVPSWVAQHTGFSLSWPQLQQMTRSGTWDIQADFGYGREDVPISKDGAIGAAFAYREYFPGQHGRGGHLETLAQFQHRVASNMAWAVRQLRLKIPGYQSLSMAIPESDYGQNGTNDPRIPHFVLSWLHDHFPVVFGGDYLSRAKHQRYPIPGRFSPMLSFRLEMGPRVSLSALHCRLLDYVRDKPVRAEYSCLRHLLPARPAFPDTHPLIAPLPPTSDPEIKERASPLAAADNWPGTGSSAGTRTWPVPNPAPR